MPRNQRRALLDGAFVAGSAAEPANPATPGSLIGGFGSSDATGLGGRRAPWGWAGLPPNTRSLWIVWSLRRVEGHVS